MGESVDQFIAHRNNSEMPKKMLLNCERNKMIALAIATNQLNRTSPASIV